MNESAWQAYDASVLIRKAGQPLFDDVLVDVGTADNFLTAGQLLPEVVGGWTCIQFCIDVWCDLCFYDGRREGWLMVTRRGHKAAVDAIRIPIRPL